jgi:hypothetical protein
MKNPVRWVGEQFGWDISTGTFPSFGGQLRSIWRTVVSNFMPNRPVYDKTQVDYNLARQLYRNDGPDTNLGAGFVRPIIDLMVEYIGIPQVTSNDDARDTHLNECLHDYWAPELQQMFRDAMRDSKAIVRFRQPMALNPLFSERDRVHGRIDLLPPEAVQIIWSPVDPDMIEKAVITHWMDVDESDMEVLLDQSVVAQTNLSPKIREHQIIEIITPDRYRFYDKTENRELQTWGGPNTLGFVPLWEAWNEYDASLGGGQSEIEPIQPFIRAFHEVLLQTLQTHKYHSSPKLHFKVKDIATFLNNNFPGTIDENGKLVPGSTISWRGREIIFSHPDEEINFIEVKSVLGDSVTLLGFLIDCICIASETPRSALIKTAAQGDKTEGISFEKKIERKRKNFSRDIQMLCKIALAAYSEVPETVTVTWPVIRLEDLAAKGQAIQQLIMGFDVASQHEWIADSTVIGILGTLFPEIQAPDIEKAEAAANVVPVVAAPAPASLTQGSQGGGNGNGGGTKSAAKQAVKQAVGTTKASNS